MSVILMSCTTVVSPVVSETPAPIATATNNMHIFTPTSTFSLIGIPSLTPAPTSTNTPKILNSQNNHWYQIFSAVGKDWISARDYCATLNAHLVTIESKYEEDFIFNNLSPYGTYAFSWLGLTDSGQEGNWQWVTGEPLTYTNWHSGQPDTCDMICESTPRPSEEVDYAIFNNMSHDWDDWGTAYIPFVCEWETLK